MKSFLVKKKYKKIKSAENIMKINLTKNFHFEEIYKILFI
jgi:hypothetical protein